MSQIELVHQQKKIVVFACVDPQIQTAVNAICELYKRTSDEILVISRAPGEININTALRYYEKQTLFFASQEYMGFVLIGRDKMRNLLQKVILRLLKVKVNSLNTSK